MEKDIKKDVKNIKFAIMISMLSNILTVIGMILLLLMVG